MHGRRTSALMLAAVLGLASPLVACDREDQRDIEEGVNDVQEGVEEGANEVEDAVDDADTDGQDDNDIKDDKNDN